MKSYLRKLKIFFILAILLTMGIIFASQRSFSLARSAEPDLMQVATEKKFAYLKNQNLASPTRVLGLTTQSGQSATSIQVLYYHGISEKENDDEVSFEHFKDQMYKLKANGFETISSQQLEDFLLHGKPLPPRSFLLTFDDGRKDSFYPVEPVLKALNYRAVMFLIAKEVMDRNAYYLTQDEIKLMLETGRWEIQAHTFDLHREANISASGEKGHALTNKLWLPEKSRLETKEEYESRIYDDLFSAKQDLEQRFGVPIQDFAYPFGDYAQGETNFSEAKDILLATVEKLYRFSFYQTWEETKTKNLPHEDTQMIKRIGVASGWTGDDLLEIILKNEDKYLPHNEAFEDRENWTSTWGETKIEDKILRINASEETTGASALLSGSNWKDFHASVSAVISSGTESFSILGRVNGDNYSECVFTKEGIFYREKQNGLAKEVAKKIAEENSELGDRLDLFMDMNGARVTCGFVDESLVLTSTVTAQLPKETRFGLSLWGRSKGKSSAKVDYLLITNANE